jgi:hypothetical protein
MLAKNGATTLIAKDIAQSGGVENDFLAIVDARVGTCAKDAGDAAFIATKGTTSSQQIAMGLDGMNCGEHLADETLHTALYLRTNTTAIKIYSLNLCTTQLGKQVVNEHGEYLIIGHMKRIETHSVDLYLRGFATWLEAYPIRLCATTISY